LDKEDNYYKILAYLDERVKFDSDIGEDALKDFKSIIRDNKYVSTYIRSLKLKMENYNSIDDFIKAMDKHEQSNKMEDVVEYEVRQLMDSIWHYESGKDPIELIHHIINNAIEREGKICDFRDSVNPDKITGSCQSEEHHEMVTDDITQYGLTEEELAEYDRIYEEDGDAYEKFIDKFNPDNQELQLTLYQDLDINKFDDDHTEYVCSKCMDYIKDNGECEVSCDME